jgi:hypothetical protein
MVDLAYYGEEDRTLGLAPSFVNNPFATRPLPPDLVEPTPSLIADETGVLWAARPGSWSIKLALA